MDKVASAKPARKPAALPATVALTGPGEDPFLPEAADALTPPPAMPRRRGLSLGAIFSASLGLLLTLSLGLWADSLIADLFARAPWLGWVAAGATGLAVLTLLALVIREMTGLRRLAKVADLRAGIAAAGPGVSAREARHLTGQVVSLVGARPQTARGRAALKDLEGEIIDGPHYLAFAERELMAPLDREARKLTLAAAQRVSVVTAVSPRAVVDVAYAAFEAMRLIRSIATLYGGRPGNLGMIRLFRDVIAHLAVTGSIAAGDALIQQVVGHGLAAKLSARLGEGVINGLMTARIGISAIDLCRPMPFAAEKRPGIGDFLSDLTRLSGRGKAENNG